MSRAKWLRVPNGTQTNGRSRSIATSAICGERPVAAGHPERRRRRRPGELGGVVALAEDAHGDTALLGGGDKFIRARRAVCPSAD